MGEIKDIMPRHSYETKVPVIILADTSGSMQGRPIEELNNGIRAFIDEVLKDEQAKKSVDLSIVSFNEKVEVVQNFAAVEDVKFDGLTLGPWTHMGKAILEGINMISNRKKFLRSQGITYYRPWLILITDGEPTDMRPGDQLWNEVKQKLREQTEGKHLIAWAFGTEEANFDVLNGLFGEGRVYKVLHKKFSEVFQWLSASMGVVSQSQPNEKIQVPNPAVQNFISLET